MAKKKKKKSPSKSKKTPKKKVNRTASLKIENCLSDPA